MMEYELDAIVDQVERLEDAYSDSRNSSWRFDTCENVIALVAEVRRLRSLVERPSAVYPFVPPVAGVEEPVCHWCRKESDEDESHGSDCPWFEARNEQAVKP